MKVFILVTAETDLETIGDWIAAGSPTRALTFVEELRERCLGLGDHPLAYPVLPLRTVAEIRRAIHGNYLIVYRVTARGVEVIRVLHGARDLGAIDLDPGAAVS